MSHSSDLIKPMKDIIDPKKEMRENPSTTVKIMVTFFAAAVIVISLCIPLKKRLRFW